MIALRDAFKLALASKWFRSSYPLSSFFPRLAPCGLRLCPPIFGSFFAIAEAGSCVQAAVDACPPRGAILLGPGTHLGPLVISKEVHIYGRGLATLECDGSADTLTSTAAVATVDGLVILKGPHREGEKAGNAVWIKAGGLRLQDCTVSSKSFVCVAISGRPAPAVTAKEESSAVVDVVERAEEPGADPVIIGCR